jgi:toxin ParE1/3/4
VIRQFRYYLLELNQPDVAIRFREAVRKTVQSVSQQPTIAPRYDLRNPQLRNLRSWPVVGFEAIRVYFVLENDGMRIIRVLHGKRDIRSLLDREKPSEDDPRSL